MQILQIISSAFEKKMDNCITYVEDRLAHDNCYWLESKRTFQDIGWIDTGNFTNDMKATIEWYRKVL